MMTTLMPLHDASHYIEKVLVNSGSARTILVHIISFESYKDWLVVGIQLEELFLRRVVGGATIFPLF
jgi:hypothetical protein